MPKEALLRVANTRFNPKTVTPADTTAERTRVHREWRTALESAQAGRIAHIATRISRARGPLILTEVKKSSPRLERSKGISVEEWHKYHLDDTGADTKSQPRDLFGVGKKTPGALSPFMSHASSSDAEEEEEEDSRDGWEDMDDV